MQKILLIIIIGLAAGRQAQAQQVSSFEYWVSSVDKAARQRTTYHISANRIEVKTGPYDFLYFSKDYAKDRLAFASPLDSAAGAALKAMALPLYRDSLKARYNNTCVIDGLILYFQFEWPDKGKSTTVSNYYLPAVAPCVDFINKHVPYRYNISYPKRVLEDLRKRCPPDLIRH